MSLTSGVALLAMMMASASAQYKLTSTEHSNLMSIYTAIACPTTWCPRISVSQKCDELLTNTDPTYAAAITCSSGGQVTQIQLGAPTTGRCPIDILAMMTALTALQIMGDRIAITTPPASLAPLAALNKLEMLNLPWHNFSGLTIPAALTALTLLTSLLLAGSQLGGPVPSGLFSALNKLRLLDISENRLTSVPSFASLQLDYLSIGENLLTGAIALPTTSVGTGNTGCFPVGKEGLHDNFYGETNCFSSCTGSCCSKYAGKLCPNSPPTTTTTARTLPPPTTRATTAPTTTTTKSITTSTTTLAPASTPSTSTPSTSTTTTTTMTVAPSTPTMATASSTTAGTTTESPTTTTTLHPTTPDSDTSSDTGTSGSLAATPAPSTPPIVIDNAALPLDAIIGGAVGGAVALILLLALVACCVARKRRHQASGAHTMALAPATATAPPMLTGADSQRDMYSTRYDDAVSAPRSGANDGVYASFSAPDDYDRGRLESVSNYNFELQSNSSEQANTTYMPYTATSTH